MSAPCAVWATAKINQAMDGRLWPAYILHSRPYQENKLLLQLLLPEQGRISAVVRRRSGKQHRALQPFQPYLLSLGGRSALKTVLQLEEQAAAYPYRGRVLYSALYLNELLCRLWPADLGSDSLFADYQQSLVALAQSCSDGMLEQALRQFEFALLAELGQLPALELDAAAQPVQAEQYYQFAAEQGLVLSPQGWRGAALLAIAAGDWQQPDALRVAKQLSRQLLAPLLGDKPLTSRALFQQLSSGPA
ncbi:DNA repair protein RecO [Alishewanella jeotgali]|uniref:DNA repair protein RecO n=1 Tax=Alishewanella jeotgali TaxID=545533 RepID=UPI001ED8D2EE|nr:DNA repair protein RecO [Alishewanella jeotgali]